MKQVCFLLFSCCFIISYATVAYVFINKELIIKFEIKKMVRYLAQNTYCVRLINCYLHSLSHLINIRFSKNSWNYFHNFYVRPRRVSSGSLVVLSGSGGDKFYEIKSTSTQIWDKQCGLFCKFITCLMSWLETLSSCLVGVKIKIFIQIHTVNLAMQY